jgi:hypothetical protein
METDFDMSLVDAPSLDSESEYREEIEPEEDDTEPTEPKVSETPDAPEPRAVSPHD